MINSVIVGCGSYLPEKTLSNHQIAEMVDTNDEWITERTGIKNRHIVGDNEFTSDISVKAANKALEAAGLEPNDIDLIVLATTTPDNTFPSTATKVQNMLGMTRGAAFDIQAVCSGFIYSLSIADNFIKSGQARTVLVIGADTLTRIVDWTDRGTCILFGDGAGALVLKAEEDTDRGILSTHLHSDGSTRDLLYVDGGVGMSGDAGKIKMEGREVFKYAVEKMKECTDEALVANDLKAEDIDWVVPHQANIRILNTTMKKIGLPLSKLVSTVDRHGNTSAASIPLALDVAIKDGRIKQGDIVALQAIGGGLAWGSCLVKW